MGKGPPYTDKGGLKMMSRHGLLFCMIAILVVAACAKTQITNRKPVATGQLPRPANVWVYDFAATPADVAADSAVAVQYSKGATPQTTEDIDIGRKMGVQVATDLVREISHMGMPARHVVAGTKPQINDIVFRGYILSIDVGDAEKRVKIGLGSGASELRVAVEGFQVTAQGLRKLGSGEAAAGDAKTPGMAVGTATLITTGNPVGLILSTGMKLYGEKSGKSKIEGRADQAAKDIAKILKQRFEEQGWI